MSDLRQLTLNCSMSLWRRAPFLKPDVPGLSPLLISCMPPESYVILPFVSTLKNGNQE